MADLAYTDTAEPRRSLRLALSGERFQVLAFVGIAALVVGFAAAGGGYFPTAWGWTSLGLMWVAALALMLAPAIDLFDEVACTPRSARRVVEDLVPSDATPAKHRADAPRRLPCQ
jgi:hypothetical protein